MKKILLPILSLLIANIICRAEGPYRLLKEIPVSGDAGWDYLSVDSSAQRLYISHGTKVVVIDLANDTVAGEITNCRACMAWPRHRNWAVAWSLAAAKTRPPSLT